MAITEDLDVLLNKLEGKIITEIIAGGSNGSIVILEIDHRYSLFLYCSWRLTRNKHIVTWNDNSDANVGDIPTNFNQLLNLKIKKIYRINCFDLVILFTNGNCINVFSDLSRSSSPTEENWFLADKVNNICYILTNEFTLITEKFDESI